MFNVTLTVQSKDSSDAPVVFCYARNVARANAIAAVAQAMVAIDDEFTTLLAVNVEAA